MKHLLLLALALPLSAQDKATEPKPLSIFDGKTLSGWNVHCLPKDQGKKYWSVHNGAIQCDSRSDGKHNYVWLIHEKEFADFELRLKLQCFEAKKGNSGIQIRSRWNPDDGQGWLNGPQIDIHPPAPWRTGFIYDETRGVQHWISPVRPSHQLSEKQAFPNGRPDGWKFHYATEEKDVWNDLKIRCIGTQITTWLNGVQITDFDGSKVLTDEHHQKANVGMKGHIALQLHSRDQILIRFKDITVLPYSKSND
ncbi:hypothetical protein NT6N_26390 [Oceaniferula spumae]|uniref:3-keto-alpha-glucoside-1,2-lyase/3-keto-2-hydroxy-glucal hydratase domain-containing protein n=1 Tax=Oceaniferula spumae TaxID=2979115 RepID=A0AAT9FNM8_9BACT